MKPMNETPILGNDFAIPPRELPWVIEHYTRNTRRYESISLVAQMTLVALSTRLLDERLES